MSELDVPAVTTEPVVQLHGVGKTYRRGGEDVRVLVDFDFTAYAGEFVVVTGPSGAGKSTLLKVIAGEVATDGGDRFVIDENVQLYTQSWAPFSDLPGILADGAHGQDIQAQLGHIDTGASRRTSHGQPDFLQQVDVLAWWDAGDGAAQDVKDVNSEANHLGHAGVLSAEQVTALWTGEQ